MGQKSRLREKADIIRQGQCGENILAVMLGWPESSFSFDHKSGTISLVQANCKLPIEFDNQDKETVFSDVFRSDCLCGL
jgi:hypothetical protein